MRRYRLASKDARSDVDLQDFTAIIEDAVHEVIPTAAVQVYKDSYTVSPTPELGDAIRIGHKLSRTGLGKHCIHIPKLFCSEETEEREDNTNGSKDRTGGHF